MMRGKRRNLEKEDPPLDGAVEIYDRILAIEAAKGEDSIFPNEQFRHEFQKGVRIFGLKDGSILLRSDTGKRLWKEFEYDIEKEG
jgi:hypothetical protein